MSGVMESVTDDMKEFAAGIVPLIEAKADAAGTIPVKIIDPGWGSSGYYSREVLQAAANSRVYCAGLQMYWNHPSKSDEKERPERDLRDLAGVLTEDARWDEQGAKGPGLYSRAKVFSAYRDAVAEMGPYIGLSHYVWGESKTGEAEGKKGDIITRIVAARSVDFVTVPGRGGAIAEAFRAARPPEPTDEQKAAGESSMGEPTPKLTLESLRKDHPEIIEAVRKEIENSAAVKEAQAQQEKKLAETEKALGEAKAENARLKEAQLLVEARTFVEAKVKDAKIPDLTKARIVESLGKSPVVKDGKLDEAAYTAKIEAAVKAEAEYLAKLGAGKVSGFGGSTPAGGQTPTLEETDKALVAGFMRLGMSEAEAKVAAGR